MTNSSTDAVAQPQPAGATKPNALADASHGVDDRDGGGRDAAGTDRKAAERQTARPAGVPTVPAVALAVAGGLALLGSFPALNLWWLADRRAHV